VVFFGVQDEDGVLKHLVLETVDLNDRELFVFLRRVLDAQRFVVDD
jgi:hypothetical protein